MKYTRNVAGPLRAVGPLAGRLPGGVVGEAEVREENGSLQNRQHLKRGSTGGPQGVQMCQEGEAE
eukprot:1182849-Prorocentrum_minimum.AAC.4